MSTGADKTTPPQNHGGYEHADVTARPILFAVGTAVAVLALVFVAMVGVTHLFATRVAEQSPPANPLAAQFGQKQPPLPRLQPAPVKDLQALHAAEDEQLHNYKWLDRQAGSVRIPIERAIEVTAERGLPARSAAAAGGAP